MAVAPPSFSGQGPQVARLPQPIDANRGIAEGLDTVARAVGQAEASTGATDDRVRESELQVERIERERALQVRAGDVATYLATEGGKLDVDLIGLRQHAAPGGVGHVDQVNERITKFRDDAAAYIGNDPELTSRFGDNVAMIGATARTGEVKWAAEQSAQKSATDGDVLQNSLQSNIRTAIAAGTASDQMLADADALDAAYIDRQPIPGNLKETWKKQRHDERIVTGIEATIDVNPNAVIEQIDKGRFSEVDDKVVAQLRERARVAADRIDNKIEQQVNASAAVARAQAGNLIEDVNGATHVDQGVLQSYLDQVSASDKPEDIRLAHDLKNALAKNAVTAKYDNSTQSERLAAIADIETHNGWQDNAQLTVAHAQLQTLIGRDDSAAEKDVLTLYQRQTGQKVPELNLADPGTMRQRFIVADQAAARYRKQVPMAFTEAEANDLRKQYNQATVEGKAAFIQTLGAYGSQRARQMMFQIAPTKPELGRLAELAASRDPAMQSLVREAADGSAVPVKDGVAGAVRGAMQRDFGPAMSRMAGDRQGAITQVATWIYAHRAAAAGKADRIDPDLARQSVNAALGASNGKGGVGNRNGAAVVLPMGSSQSDFDRLLAIGAAHPDAVRGAANGVPTWGGRPLHQREFLDLVPVLVHDDGVIAAYAFRSRSGSGYVKNERGLDYLLDTRSLAKALVAPPNHANRGGAAR